MELEELQELSRHTIKRFKEVEPREWGIEGTIVELIGEVGSLAHCTMLYDKYKPGTVNLSKIKDEVSDVLFIIFKLADICGITIPKHMTIEPIKTTLADLTIDLGRHLGLILNQVKILQNGTQESPITAKISSNLTCMISLLGQIANLVGFSLEEAHKTELKIAELWLDTQLVRGRYYKNLISKVKFWLARSSAHSSSK